MTALGCSSTCGVKYSELLHERDNLRRQIEAASSKRQQPQKESNTHNCVQNSACNCSQVFSPDFLPWRACLVHAHWQQQFLLLHVGWLSLSIFLNLLLTAGETGKTCEVETESGGCVYLPGRIAQWHSDSYWPGLLLLSLLSISRDQGFWILSFRTRVSMHPHITTGKYTEYSRSGMGIAKNP